MIRVISYRGLLVPYICSCAGAPEFLLRDFADFAGKASEVARAAVTLSSLGGVSSKLVLHTAAHPITSARSLQPAQLVCAQNQGLGVDGSGGGGSNSPLLSGDRSQSHLVQQQHVKAETLGDMIGRAR